MSIIPQQRDGYIYWTPPTKPLKEWSQRVKVFFLTLPDDKNLLPRMKQHMKMAMEYLKTPRDEETVLATMKEIDDLQVCCDYVRHVLEERHLAFAMATQSRLGAKSRVNGMLKDTFDEVLRQQQEGSWF